MDRSLASRRYPFVAVAVFAVLSLSGCAWTTYRADPGHSGHVDGETRINVGNVGALQETFTAGSVIHPAPAIANGRLFVVHVGFSNGSLGAYDAAGSQGCAGSPKVCAPLWTAPNIPNGQPPAVANGIVYVSGGSMSPNAFGTVFAIDAAGQTNCSGSPVVCTPLWTAPTAGGFLSPATVAGGRLFVVGSEPAGDRVYAFDAAGSEGCSGSPKVCAPLWTGAAGPATFGAGYELQHTPAVVNGRVYVPGDDAKVRVYDAAGTDGCGGAPKSCEPLWTTAPTCGDSCALVGAYTVPIVTNNRLYMWDGSATAVFDGNGDISCGGSPRTCSPLWTYPGAVQAVAGGFAYAGGLAVYDANGVTNCGGSPAACTPLWTTSVKAGAPAVANGVVYAVDNDIQCDITCTVTRHAYAFDASGSTGCSGVPTQCAPLLDAQSTSADQNNPPVFFAPEIANGVLYVSEDAGVHAFTLP